MKYTYKYIDTALIKGEVYIMTNKKEKELKNPNVEKLTNEELDKINAGAAGGKLGWFWDDVYAIKTWSRKEDVEFIFNYTDTLKIITFFGGGDEGQVVGREAVYSSEDGGWIDKYLVDIGTDTNYWCKRNVIVH